MNKVFIFLAILFFISCSDEVANTRTETIEDILSSQDFLLVKGNLKSFDKKVEENLTSLSKNSFIILREQFEKSQNMAEKLQMLSTALGVVTMNEFTNQIRITIREPLQQIIRRLKKLK